MTDYLSETAKEQAEKEIKPSKSVLATLYIMGALAIGSVSCNMFQISVHAKEETALINQTNALSESVKDNALSIEEKNKISSKISSLNKQIALESQEKDKSCAFTLLSMVAFAFTLKVKNEYDSFVAKKRLKRFEEVYHELQRNS